MKKKKQELTIRGIKFGELCFRCMGTGKEIKEKYEDGNPYYDGDMFGFDPNTYKKCTDCKGTGKKK